MVSSAAIKAMLPPGIATTFPLTDAQRGWLASRYGGFTDAKKTRGARNQNNAQNHVTKEVVPQFLAQFYGNLSDDAKVDQYIVIRADYTIYSWYTNKWRHDPTNPKAQAPAVSTKSTAKIYAGDLWAKANPEVVDLAVKKQAEETPDQEAIAIRRTVVCRLFGELSPEQRGPWERKAEEDKQLNAAKAGEPLTGEAREKFARASVDAIGKILKDLQQKSGALGVCYVAVEKEGDNSRLVINTITCDALDEFKGTAGELAELVTEQTDKPVEGAKPRAAVVPGKDGRPVIPDLGDTPRLRHVRRVVRVGIAANWIYVGGEGPVPWITIQRALAAGIFTWIPESRLPVLENGEIAPFMDPGKMSLEVAMAFYRQLRIYQEKPPNWELSAFQFEEVFASVRHKWPSPSAVFSTTKARRGNREVLLVHYEGFVEHPQVCGVIPYPKDTWEWQLHVLNKTTSELWKGLPSRPETQISPVISEAEAEVYAFWFETISEQYSYVRDLVHNSVRNLNTMESLIPIWGGGELWAETDIHNCVPDVLPVTRPSDEMIEAQVSKYRFWVGVSLFCPPDEARQCATLSYLEGWQKRMRSGCLYHEDSKTYKGGKFGAVWVFRALLPVLANAAAACNQLPPPIAPPMDYNLTRLSVADFGRIIQWLSDWNDLISASCENLRASYEQRIQPLALEESTTPEEEDPAGSDSDRSDNPNPTASDLADRLTMLANQAPPRKSKSKAQLKLAEESDQADSTGTGSDETLTVAPLESSDEETQAKRVSKGPYHYLKVPKRSRVDYAAREYLFRRQVLPKPTSEFHGHRTALESEMKKFLETCPVMVDVYLETQRSVGKQYSSKMIEQVRARVADAEEGNKDLLDCVLAHRGAWLKAEKLAIQGTSQHAAFWNFLRVGARILVAYDRLAAEYSDVAEQLELNRCDVAAWTWVCRIGFEQFSTTAKLSLAWANRLEDAWETISDDAPFDELASLVASIRDWRNDFSALRKYHRKFRRLIMGKYVTGPIVDEWMDCWYTYGNPGEQAMTGVTEDLVEGIPAEFSYLSTVCRGSNERMGLSDNELVMVECSMLLDPETTTDEKATDDLGTEREEERSDEREKSTSEIPEKSHDGSASSNSKETNASGEKTIDQQESSTEVTQVQVETEQDILENVPSKPDRPKRMTTRGAGNTAGGSGARGGKLPPSTRQKRSATARSDASNSSTPVRSDKAKRARKTR